MLILVNLVVARCVKVVHLLVLVAEITIVVNAYKIHVERATKIFVTNVFMYAKSVEIISVKHAKTMT